VTDQEVIPGATVNGVHSRTACDLIVTLTTEQEIISSAT